MLSLKNSPRFNRLVKLNHPQIPNICVLPTREAAAYYSANFIADIVRKKPHARISFATGNTQIPVYRNLVDMQKRGLVSFKKITAFQLDEYYPCRPDQSFSFVKFLHNHVFFPLSIPQRQIFMFNGLTKKPHVEAERYNDLLSKRAIDLTILGIGPNSHIAFNESGSLIKSKTRLVNLSAETVYRDNTVRKQGSPKQALTQGLANIIKSKIILQNAYGASYGPVLKNALYEPISNKRPSSYLRTVGSKVTIVVDADAAKSLKDSPELQTSQ